MTSFFCACESMPSLRSLSVWQCSAFRKNKNKNEKERIQLKLSYVSRLNCARESIRWELVSNSLRLFRCYSASSVCCIVASGFRLVHNLARKRAHFHGFNTHFPFVSVPPLVRCNSFSIAARADNKQSLAYHLVQLFHTIWCHMCCNEEI